MLTISALMTDIGAARLSTKLARSVHAHRHTCATSRTVYTTRHIVSMWNGDVRSVNRRIMPVSSRLHTIITDWECLEEHITALQDIGVELRTAEEQS